MPLRIESQARGPYISNKRSAALSGASATSINGKTRVPHVHTALKREQTVLGDARYAFRANSGTRIITWPVTMRNITGTANLGTLILGNGPHMRLMLITYNVHAFTLFVGYPCFVFLPSTWRNCVYIPRGSIPLLHIWIGPNDARALLNLLWISAERHINSGHLICRSSCFTRIPGL